MAFSRNSKGTPNYHSCSPNMHYSTHVYAHAPSKHLQICLGPQKYRVWRDRFCRAVFAFIAFQPTSQRFLQDIAGWSVQARWYTYMGEVGYTYMGVNWAPFGSHQIGGDSCPPTFDVRKFHGLSNPPQPPPLPPAHVAALPRHTRRVWPRTLAPT